MQVDLTIAIGQDAIRGLGDLRRAVFFAFLVFGLGNSKFERERGGFIDEPHSSIWKGVIPGSDASRLFKTGRGDNQSRASPCLF
jgi:hypothetical protein